jgi:hypothetical protein
LREHSSHEVSLFPFKGLASLLKDKAPSVKRLRVGICFAVSIFDSTHKMIIKALEVIDVLSRLIDVCELSIQITFSQDFAASVSTIVRIQQQATYDVVVALFKAQLNVTALSEPSVGRDVGEMRTWKDRESVWGYGSDLEVISWLPQQGLPVAFCGVGRTDRNGSSITSAA